MLRYITEIETSLISKKANDLFKNKRKRAYPSPYPNIRSKLL